MSNAKLGKVSRQGKEVTAGGSQLYVFILFCVVVALIVTGVVIWRGGTNELLDTGSSAISSPEYKEDLEPRQQEGVAGELSERMDGIVEPSVGIIVADLGLSAAILQEVYKLPREISLGFSPYANNVTELINEAERNEYRTVMNLPMQPYDYPFANLGPYCLLDILSDQENVSRIEWVLSKSDVVYGVYANPGEVFTESDENLQILLPAMNEYKKASDQFIFFYRNDGNVKSVNRYLKEMPHGVLQAVIIDIVISADMSAEVVKEKLLYAESIAKSRGGAVILFYPDYRSIEILKNWLEKLNNVGIKLLPIERLVKKARRNYDHMTDRKKDTDQ